jgi:hypothetical protein
MLTRWGKKNGWEIQRLVIRRKVFYRLTGSDWCGPASFYERVLWKALPKKQTEVQRG